MSRNVSTKLKQLKSAELNVAGLLKSLGYDMTNPDIEGTPNRVARLLSEYVDGGQQPDFKTFPHDCKSMVTVVDHRAYTKCPHHLETVEMDISIAYIPNGRLLGVSKFARAADYFAKGLMLQEEVAEMITEGLMQALDPLGVAVFIVGKHMCIRSRGVKSYNSTMVTTVVKGLFETDIKAREEFFNTISIVRQGGR